jgi:PPP family 3-phenylpropionic acid transporter
VIGLSSGVGICAEIAGMFCFPWLASRFGIARILVLCFAVSAVRWLGVASVTTAAGLVALSTLHAATFGLFYVGMVALVAECVGANRAASGQALFSSVVFGLGGATGSALAGALYEWLGGPPLFAGAALLDGVAAVVLVAVIRARVTAPPAMSYAATSAVAPAK